MKKWIITAAVVIGLAVAAATSGRWLAPFLAFLGTNSTTIQTLGSLVQIVLWVCAGVAFVAGLWRIKKSEAGLSSKPRNKIHSTAKGERGAAVGDMSGGNVITGNNNNVGEQVEVSSDHIGGDKLHITGETVTVDQRVTYIREARTPGTSALHQLPALPRDFTGREAELDELMRGIEQGGISISGLQGQGGIGKTALALVLAHQIKPRYPDAQFFLDLKGTTTPLAASDAMAHVIRGYHPTAKLPEDEATLRGLYNSVLDGKRALLLMDNARDAAQIEPLIPPDGCVLLITSRWHFYVGGLVAKELDMLPPEAAHKLLRKIAPRIREHDAEIARLCGYLPFALQLAASALVERRDLSPADYARRLADERERLKMLGAVEASLSLSYELLSAERQKQWRALGVFHGTFDVAAAAAVLKLERDAAHDALGELINYSLLEFDEADTRYSLHDLARLSARQRLSDKERLTAELRHSAHYIAVLVNAEALYLQGGDAVARGLAMFDAERTNIEAGQAWAAQHADERTAVRLCAAYPLAGVNVFSLRLHPREQINWLEQALSAARETKDRYMEANVLGNLGNTYTTLGEPRRAIEFHKQHLDITLEIGDRKGKGNALGNLGNAYIELGEPSRAIEFYEQDLAIRKEIGDRRGEGTLLLNLGVAYATLDETRHAIGFFEQTLKLCREIGYRLGEGTALINLGNAYASLGELHQAIKFYEQQLVITREIGNRRDEGIALFNMSMSVYKIGEQARAIELAEAALTILEQREEPNAPRVRAWLERLRRQTK